MRLTKTRISEGVCFVYHFQIMSRNFSAIWQKLFCRLSKIPSTCLLKKLRGELVFFGKNFILSSSFSDMERFFLDSNQNLSIGELSKLHTTGAWKNSEEKENLLRKISFPDQLPKMSKKLVALLSKTFQGLSKRRSIFPTDLPEEISFFQDFSDKDRKFCRHLAKVFWWCCQKCFLPAYRNIKKRNVFLKRNLGFLPCFWTWSEIFLAFNQKFSPQNCQTAYSLSMEIFWVKRIFIGRNDFCDQLPKLSEKVVAYCVSKFLQGLSKRCSNCWNNQADENWFFWGSMFCLSFLDNERENFDHRAKFSR